MKVEIKKEIESELELGTKAIISCTDILRKKFTNEFIEDVNLRTASNRLFLAIEHFANCMTLLEYGGFSKKHMKDIEKYKIISEKLKFDVNLKELYVESYGIRKYADYGGVGESEFRRERVESILKNTLIFTDSLIKIMKEKKIKIPKELIKISKRGY